MNSRSLFVSILAFFVAATAVADRRIAPISMERDCIEPIAVDTMIARMDEFEVAAGNDAVGAKSYIDITEMVLAEADEMILGGVVAAAGTMFACDNKNPPHGCVIVKKKNDCSKCRNDPDSSPVAKCHCSGCCEHFCSTPSCFQNCNAQCDSPTECEDEITG